MSTQICSKVIRNSTVTGHHQACLLIVQIKCAANKDAMKHTCDECGLSLSNSYSLHRHLKSQHREYYLRKKEERLRKKEEQAMRKQEIENVSHVGM